MPTGYCFQLIMLVCRLLFVEEIFQNTIKVSNGLNPEQARRFAGSDQDSNFAKALADALVDRD